MRGKWLFAAICLVAVHGIALADGPIEEFKATASTSMMLCKITGKNVVLSYQLGDESLIREGGRRLEDCIAKAEADARTGYQRASGPAGKRKAAVALKDYYAIWLSSLRGVRVKPDDSEMSYTQRIRANDQRLEDAWAKVEIDAGL